MVTDALLLISPTQVNKKDMTPEQLKKRVDNIIAMASDDEGAHSAEDDLHLQVIYAFAPEWAQNEIERLSVADFNRWCA